MRGVGVPYKIGVWKWMVGRWNFIPEKSIFRCCVSFREGITPSFKKDSTTWVSHFCLWLQQESSSRQWLKHIFFLNLENQGNEPIWWAYFFKTGCENYTYLKPPWQPWQTPSPAVERPASTVCCLSVLVVPMHVPPSEPEIFLPDVIFADLFFRDLKNEASSAQLFFSSEIARETNRNCTRSNVRIIWEVQ